MEDLARLRWQCRRGTLELDRLLTNYLQLCYAKSNLEEQALFRCFLNYEDNHLLKLLIDDNPAESLDITTLIQKIRIASKRSE